MSEALVIISSEDHLEPGTVNERKSLLKKPSKQTLAFNSSKCISSKAALVVIACVFWVSALYTFLLDEDSYSSIISILSQCKYSHVTSSAVSAILSIFCPLAGHLADIKFGRHKTVFGSLKILLLGIVMATVGMTFYCVSLKVMALRILAYIILAASSVLGIIGAVGFAATVIQFGLDQLHESPSDHQSVFIHWLIWAFFAANLVVALADSINIFEGQHKVVSLSILGAVLVIVIIVLLILLCTAHRKRSWFLIEPGRINPYNLVYSVTKYAHQHKVPVNRSAFTYCEDEIPKGLDLGKSKYGGPFTIEQVEDVKAFYGVLKVLFSASFTFILYSAADPVLSVYQDHLTNQTSNSVALQVLRVIILQGEVLYYSLGVLCIPFYLFFLRPIFFNYIPGMLKRIGIGIVLIILSLLCSFIVDTITHIKIPHLGCMFSGGMNKSSPASIQHEARLLLDYLLLCQSIILALSNMFMLIGMLEFICSQTPHSMKGLVIGLNFALNGTFKALGLATVIPFALFWKASSIPSCGMYYYLGTTVWGLLSLLLYSLISRQYKYRIRDEPSRVQHYVEEYYSKIREETSSNT